jgi:hypothetical protein
VRRIVIMASVCISLALLAIWLGPRTVQSFQISRAQTRWQAAAIRNYTWTIETGCFGPCTNGSPLTITVRSGQPVRASAPQSMAAEYSTTPKTIDDLFERVRDLTGSGRFEVDYDAVYGFPVSGSFDPSAAFDDEFGFTVTSFEPAQEE